MVLCTVNLVSVYMLLFNSIPILDHRLAYICFFYYFRYRYQKRRKSINPIEVVCHFYSRVRNQMLKLDCRTFMHIWVR